MYHKFKPMAKFLVEGGSQLNGEICLSGSKNAATKMMVASLLTDDECVLENFPEIGDTAITSELLLGIGSKIATSKNVCRIKTADISRNQILSLTRKNRIPILVLGPLLARTGKAEVPILGGDKIGPRPVDIHLSALGSLGAKIEASSSGYRAEAPGGLHGAKISFRYPSVGATENTILAAVLAKGRTIVENAAVEPEIIDLIKMLQKMGAIIELGTHRTIYIDGVQKLHGTKHKIMPDRNEAASFACLAAASGGRVRVNGISQDHLITFLNAIRRIGGQYLVEEGGIIFWRDAELMPAEIETDAHPGFMTDWQQPFAVLLTAANGISFIHETVYEDRFGYAGDLNLMGANIKILTKCIGELNCRFAGKNFYHSAIIEGSRKLKAQNLKVRDIRAGMAHLIAALVAEGTSEIDGAEEIDRGYENIDERLRSIGAKIKRV